MGNLTLNKTEDNKIYDNVSRVTFKQFQLRTLMIIAQFIDI